MGEPDSLPPDTLSDSDAVSLLFELTGAGEPSSESLLRLDAVVYGRLAQTYDGEEPASLPDSDD